MSLQSLPAPLLYTIFCQCEPKEVAECRLVCQRFAQLLDEQSFWLRYCEHRGVTLPPLAWRRFVHSKSGKHPECFFDYRKILSNPFRMNICQPLLRSFQEMTRQYGWQFIHDGSGMVIERPPRNCQQHNDIPMCLATSFMWCSRIMEYTFAELGVQDWIMDKIRPRIIVKEWIAPNTECSSSYELNIQLLQRHQRFEVASHLEAVYYKKELREFEEDSVIECGKWEEVEIVAEQYPAGVRKIAVVSCGIDTRGMAGYYGSKFANTTIRLEFPKTLQYLAEDELSEKQVEDIGESTGFYSALWRAHDENRGSWFKKLTDSLENLTANEVVEPPPSDMDRPRFSHEWHGFVEP